MLLDPPSVPDGKSSAPTTDALILSLYREMARDAVKLAAEKVRLAYPAYSPKGRSPVCCGDCAYVAPTIGELQHGAGCIVGRVRTRAALIERLESRKPSSASNLTPSAVPARAIEYAACTAPDGELRAARVVTHEEAARERAVQP